MVETTLTEIREHVRTLASTDGEYFLVCGRTGDRPVPAAGLRFGTRATARTAARATEQYRSELRQYDPHLPFYDVVVCQDTELPGRVTGPPETEREAEAGALSDTAVSDTGPEPGAGHRHLVEYCHRVAAAVFESLSDAGYGDVESAIVDAYFDLAETVADPDRLCLRLLESMADELDAHLGPAEQGEVLGDAAERLGELPAGDDPVAATCRRLRGHGLLGGFVQAPWSVDLDAGTQSVTVRLTGYALSPRDDRLPVLPVVVGLHRRDLDWQPSTVDVAPTDDGWRLTLELARDREPAAPVCARIRERGSQP